MSGTSRFRTLDTATLSAEQRAVYDAIAKPRAGQVPAPFHLLLESPELCQHVQALGAFCRFRTGLNPRLSELAILTVASYWNAEYEFAVHSGEARKAGVPEHEIEALGAGKPPAFRDDDARLVHEFTLAFLKARDVPDATFDRTVARFGRRTVTELTGLIGYYSMLAILLGVFRVPPDA